MHEATLYEKKKGNAVRCTACVNYCTIAEGKSGICGVRANKDGKLYLLVYGQAAAMHVDPMEKKPLYHFLPGESILSVGTIGCNFGCSFCQNWDTSQASKSLESKKEPFKAPRGKFGFQVSPAKIVALCTEKKIPAVAFTYNEPAIFFEYAFDTMTLAKKAGIKTVFVSNGYESKEALEAMKGHLDAINIDLKAFTEEFYRKTCQARLAPVLETIRRCHDMGIWIEITTLIIPGENDSAKELEEIAAFIASVDERIPWHLSAFHPDYKMQDAHATPHETLLRAYAIGKKHLQNVYIGNVRDPAHSATACPACKRIVIERDGFDARMVGMRDGACAHCKEKIAGVFL